MKKVKTKQTLRGMIRSEWANRIAFFALCALALAVVIALASLFFSVRAFEVEGDTHYELGELIDLSGIRLGDRLYWLNKGRAEKKLLDSCPYLKDVKIKSKFPNKICFSVEERVAGWYVQIGDDLYALDYDLKVIHETEKEEGLTVRGMTRLVLPELNSAIVGEYPGFASGDEHLMTETLKIIDAVRTHSIKERLTYLDLSNRFEIKMTVDGAYDINFGDMDGYEDKLKLIVETISTAEEKGYSGGEISIGSSGELYWRPAFSEE